jgi:hypothetical protein
MTVSGALISRSGLYVGTHFKNKPLNDESRGKQKEQKEQKRQTLCLFCPFCSFCFPTPITLRII